MQLAVAGGGLNVYGTDLYPGGPVSAYRMYDQQADYTRRSSPGTGLRPIHPARRYTSLGQGWMSRPLKCAG